MMAQACDEWRASCRLHNSSHIRFEFGLLIAQLTVLGNLKQ